MRPLQRSYDVISIFQDGSYRMPNLPLASVFTALHVMQTRSSDENSVCLSHACLVTKR